MTTSSTPPESAYTRLHIAPFSPELVHLIVPTSLRSSARNISYHAVETRPDQPYGFVDLPTADAERIRKKLHGAVLKGSKVRVELARESTMAKPAGKDVLADPDVEEKDRKAKKREEKSKKRKRNDVVIPAVQLEEGRKVKRGWTEPAGAAEADEEGKSAKKQKKDKSEKKDKKSKDKKDKKKLKSQYTDGPECLVKTVIPAGKPMPESSSKDKRKKKKGQEREITVHEFANSKGFPSFLKSSTSATTSAATETEYVNGVGWVDQDGKVVEPLKSSRPVPSKEPKKVAKPARAPPVDEDDSETSSSGSSSSEDEEQEEDDDEADSELAKPRLNKLTASTAQPDLPSETSTTLDSPRPKSSGSARNLSIKIPPPITPAANKVHPLEALYKRTKTDGTPGEGASSTAKPFSFFGDGGEEATPENGSRLAQPPMTPFTQEDFEWRNVRSAAPTPDTAHPNKTFKLWPRDDAEDDIAEEDEGGDGMGKDTEMTENGVSDVNGHGDNEQGPDAATGDFQSWFWENRGDTNRSWKRRKKLSAKDKRYRANKARAERAI